MSIKTFPLSSQQERVWLMMELFPENASIWNIVTRRSLTGSFHFELFLEAFRRLLYKHEALNYIIEKKYFKPCIILDASNIKTSNKIELIDISEYTPEAQEEMLARHYNRQRITYRFELESSLILLTIFKLREDQFDLFINIHHSIADMRSLEILWIDLVNIYNNLHNHSNVSEISDTYAYSSYIIWQRQHIKENRISEQYWMEKLKNRAPLATFPIDHFSSLQNRSFDASSLSFLIQNEQLNQIKSFSYSNRIAPSSFFLTALVLLLHKYSGQTDMTIGTYLNGRSIDINKMKSVYNTIGMFVNTLVIRINIEPDTTVLKLLNTVYKNYTEAYQHQQYPYQNLIYNLNPKRNKPGTALFNIGFNYMTKKSSNLNMIGVSCKEISKNRPEIFIETDLNLRILEDEGNCHIFFDYNSKLYNNGTIQRLLESFKNIINNLIENENILIRDFYLLASEEFKIIIENINNTNKEYAETTKAIISIINQHVTDHPNKTALIAGSNNITYNTLWLKSNELAAVLLNSGISKGDFVPVIIDHSEELIISLLAIMKIGAIYVPLDIDWPEERLKSILTHLTVKIILTHSSFIEKLKEVDSPKFIVDSSKLHLLECFNSQHIDANDTFYLLFTSGSTGESKGVIISYAAFINRLLWMNDHFGNESSTNVLLTTRYVFDSSLWQILWPLINGGTCVIIANLLKYSVQELIYYIEEYHITTIDFVPSYFELFSAQAQKLPNANKNLGSLKNIILGGEAIIVDAALKFKRLFTNIRLTNLYGPTEATIGCIFYEIIGTEKHTIPIGKPISNMKAFIVDTGGLILPIGVCGEIVVSGVGVAKGYHNDVESTKRAFIFNSTIGDAVYRTGDFGKINNQGEIEFLGRMDDQISLRGFRIEPIEIESKIISFPGVSQAIVTVIENSTQIEKLLCAYFRAIDPIDIPALKNYLISKLPSYMVPTYFLQVKGFELSSSGKINRKALPLPETASIDNKNEELFSDKEEETIADIWTNLLNLKAPIKSNQTNFFEIGGHSLKAMEMIFQLNEIFNSNVSLIDFFNDSTIAGVRKILYVKKDKDTPEIIPNSCNGICDLSYQQQQMYILHQLHNDKTTYNIPMCFEVDGEITHSSVKAAVLSIMQNNDILRTTFHIKSNKLVQIIHATMEAPVYYLPWQDKISAKTLVAPFDLEVGPLFRIYIFKKNDHKHIVFFDIHHIIFDGLSVNTFLMEFLQNLCKPTPRNKASIQYTDYVSWLLNPYYQNKMLTQESYWLNVYKEFIPKDIFGQHKTSGLLESHANHFQFEIENDIIYILNEMKEKYNGTLFTIMFALYNLLIFKITKERCIVVGTPVSGRRHRDVQNAIGLFATTLAIKNDINPKNRLEHFFLTIKKNIFEALEHQDYPLVNLVKTLPLKYRKQNLTIFQVVFAFQNDYMLEFKNENFRVHRSSAINSIPHKAKSVLSFWCKQTRNSIIIDVEYLPFYFTEEQVKSLSQQYKELVLSTSKNSYATIEEIISPSPNL
jgi:amino acid adenylation domain-containing protein